MHHSFVLFNNYITADNVLTGTIPSEIGSLTDLNDFEICKLSIHKSISKSHYEQYVKHNLLPVVILWWFLIFYFLNYITADNILTGSLPSEIKALPNLNDVDLCKL